jgi:predicted ATPase
LWIEGKKSAAAAFRAAEEVLAIAIEHGFPVWLGVGNVIRGWCLGAMGQSTDGILLMRQGLAVFSGTGAKLALPLVHMMLAEAYRMAARPAEGLNELDVASEVLETTQERFAEPEMHRLRGALLLAAHQRNLAESSFERALAVARQQGAKLWELRAANSLAQFWRDQGKRYEARELLAPVYGWFTEGFDTRDLKEAKALLDELSS